MSTAVGVDVGGTKLAVAIDDPGGVRLVEVPSTGWDAEPVDVGAQWLHERLIGVGIEPGDARLVVGAQGLDSPVVASGLTDALVGLGWAAVRCVNDAELLVPAAGRRAGIAVIAGTGAIAVGRDGAGRTLIAGGWGWVLGDDAGATGIVREATRAALLAHDDGRPDDGLLSALCAAFGVADAERLARAVNDDPTPAHWAPRAPAVFSAAAAGSALAMETIEHAALHLAMLVGQLRSRGAVGLDVVAAGGVIRRQPVLLAALRRQVALVDGRLVVELLDVDPVMGALALARDL